MKFLAALAAAIILAGCANNPHADAGKRLNAQGKPDQALLELEQAVREEPANIEARSELEHTRIQLANRYVVEGENARISGRLDVAEGAFKRALEVIPGYPRAQQGLSQVAIDRRHADLVAQADALLKKDDLNGAESSLRIVLAQNPAHAQARKLMKAVERRRASTYLDEVPNPALTKPVTFEFRDTPLRSVFEILSRTSGINFVFDKDVRSDIKITIFVHDSTVEDVMKLILSTNQLGSKPLNANSILVYPNNAGKLAEYRNLVVKTFYLANADVKQAQALLKAIVKTKDMFIDEKLNLIVIKDTPEAVRLAEKLLDSLDLPEPEVMLEVEVMEVSRSKLLDLGIQFPDQVGYGILTPNIVNTTITTTGTGTNTTLGGVLQPGNVNLRDHPGLTTYVTNPAALLNLQDHDGSSRLLANPRIRVKNRQKAKILIGDKVPVFTTTSTANVGVSASVTYLDVGLKLDVEPDVSLEDDVSIKVGLEVSRIASQVAGPAGSVAYQIGTRSAETALSLHNGETQVLAGLINDEERSTANRLPGLGDFPVLGRLFSSQNDTSSKTEIVLLITPRIVRNLMRPEVVEPAVQSGTETTIGVGPLRLNPTEPNSLLLRNEGAVSPDAAAPAPEAPEEGQAAESPAPRVIRRRPTTQ